MEMQEFSRYVQGIANMLPQDELLAALSEALLQFSSAALEYRRAINKINPIPKDIVTCHKNMIQEHARVCLTLYILDFKDKDHRQQIEKQLAKRWYQRIYDERNNNYGG